MRPFKISVVLARSIYETNIGATSRAMANMGAQRLILVDPKCEITFAAQQAAATGQEALQNRVVYPSWQEFHASEAEGIRIAFTTKNGKARHVRDFSEVLSFIESDSSFKVAESSGSDSLSIYLIFGPEDWGLSNFDLDLTHFNVCLPTFGDNVSLNLAQAVLLALFQLRLQWGGTRTSLEGRALPRRMKTEAVERESGTLFPEQSLRVWLTEMGFDVTDRKISAFTVMRRILLHNVPNKKEMNMLETVLQQGIRKLREYNKLRKQLGLPFVSGSEHSKSAQQHDPNEVQ